MDKTTAINAAIDQIKSGDMILMGGFSNIGCPLHLLYALAKKPEIN